MNYEDFIKLLKDSGAEKIRDGRHMVWRLGEKRTPVPYKHGKEIDRYTAQSILTQLGIKHKI